MPVRLSDIPAEGLSLAYRHDPALLEPLGEGIRLLDAADVRLTITPEGDRYLIQGEVSATIEVECARCLTPVTLSVETPCLIDAVPVSKPDEDDRHELGRGDLDVTFYSGDLLDLDGVVRDQLLLAVPMRPLCREGCLGLCASCGKNRNDGACGCPDPTVLDPRFEALRQLTGSRTHRTPGKRRE